ncbi:hypothetical protein KUV57_13165 [Epibacterium sp. DP7N7-1]|nr:hypothetical protein [Epibacterium sp. DP7N7-1]
MKKLIISTCLTAIAMTSAPQFASAGGWATAPQASRIIGHLQSINKNQIQTGKNVKAVEEQVENSMKEAADRIIAALRGHSAEQSSYQDKQIEATRRITDAAELNATDRMRQEFRARAESGEFDPSPDICLLAGLFRDSGATSSTPRGSSTVAGARQLSNGGDPAVRQGGTARAKSAIDERAELAGAMGGFSDPTVDVASILQNPTLSMESDEDRRAAERLVRNLTDPNPPRPLTSAEMQTPEGVSRAEERSIQETRNNATAEVVSMVMNMRTEVGPTEPWQPYIEDISNYNRPIGDQVSELQAIDIRTLRHYAPKPEIFQERAAWSEKQLLQEILDVVSIQARMQYMQLELDSRRGIVESQILSVLNNGT